MQALLQITEISKSQVRSVDEIAADLNARIPTALPKLSARCVNTHNPPGHSHAGGDIADALQLIAENIDSIIAAFSFLKDVWKTFIGEADITIFVKKDGTEVTIISRSPEAVERLVVAVAQEFKS